jgi:hypothetical protein
LLGFSRSAMRPPVSNRASSASDADWRTSQAIGGIIWGVGQALLEQAETDPVMGRFLNRNYSGYLVPTNADIPELDVPFVGEFDKEATVQTVSASRPQYR